MIVYEAYFQYLHVLHVIYSLKSYFYLLLKCVSYLAQHQDTRDMKKSLDSQYDLL